MASDLASARASRTAALASFCSVATWLSVMLTFAAMRPGYSHVANYISELGETGAPRANWVNWFGFVSIGTFVLLFISVGRKAIPIPGTSAVLLSGIAWAYILSAFFPCDAGCPEQGTMSQLIHNLTAAIAYPATILGLVAVAAARRHDPKTLPYARFTLGCATTAGVGFVLLLQSEIHAYRGLVQRVTEASIFVWIAATSLRLWRQGQGSGQSTQSTQSSPTQ